MRKLIAISAAALCLVSLSACSSGTADYSSDNPSNGTNHDTSDVPSTFYVKLSNGSQVLCAGINGLDGGGAAAPTTISCDWTNAQHLNKSAGN